MVSKMKNLPKIIYLNFGDAFIFPKEYAECDFGELVDITWCIEKINRFDPPYIRKDIYNKVLRENRQLKEKLKEQEKLIFWGTK